MKKIDNANTTKDSVYSIQIHTNKYVNQIPFKQTNNNKHEE